MSKKNSVCPNCGRTHKTYEEAWKCGVEAGCLLSLCRLEYETVPDEIFREAYRRVCEMSPYLKSLPGYPKN